MRRLDGKRALITGATSERGIGMTVAQRYAREGRDVVLIGHAGHPEVEGTMGQFDTRLGGAIHLVESPQDVDSLSPGQPDVSLVVDAAWRSA